MRNMEYSLKVISWNITRVCNLRCSHCYLPAAFRLEDSPVESPSDELTTEKALQVIDQIAEVNSEVMLVLSGGEPLMRRDVFKLAEHAHKRGIMVVLGTNGLLINDKVIGKMKQAGVSGVSISLDSVSPEIHDSSRQANGAWKRAVAAIEMCRANDLSVQISAVVTRNNYDEVPDLIEFARSLRANVFSPFFMVCTGRGEEFTDITAVQYEELLSMLVHMQRKRGDMMIRTRCAPTFRRILYQIYPGSNLLKLDAGKCMAGTNYCRITPEGSVTPCPYMETQAGKLTNEGFHQVWHHSSVFAFLRKATPKGKCGECEFIQLCGGCRARALSAHGDILAEDPWCAYYPAGGDIINPPVFQVTSSVTDRGSTCSPVWSSEAEERMKRIPFFVRSMIRSAIERYAADNKYREITPEVLAKAREDYGMGKMTRP
ncbi:MAG: radical SAM protein [Nitrospiraceae bacterium]|nr:MAG: radical SAM protein [Nitrospiraceae bacterium]